MHADWMSGGRCQVSLQTTWRSVPWLKHPSGFGGGGGGGRNASRCRLRRPTLDSNVDFEACSGLRCTMLCVIIDLKAAERTFRFVASMPCSSCPRTSPVHKPLFYRHSGVAIRACSQAQQWPSALALFADLRARGHGMACNDPAASSKGGAVFARRQVDARPARPNLLERGYERLRGWVALERRPADAPGAAGVTRRHPC